MHRKEEKQKNWVKLETRLEGRQWLTPSANYYSRYFSNCSSEACTVPVKPETLPTPSTYL